MKRLIILLALFFSFSNAQSQETMDDNGMVVFVGRLLTFEHDDDACTFNSGRRNMNGAEVTEIGFPGKIYDLCVYGGVMEARYEVLEVLYGQVSNHNVTFKAVDNLGFYDFADYQHALLFVSDASTTPHLEQYQGFAVHRTIDNRWATCGNPYDMRYLEPDELRNLTDLEFVHGFDIVGDQSERVINRRYDKRFFTIEDGQIKCTKGVLVEDMYDLVRLDVLRKRNIYLPELGAR